MNIEIKKSKKPVEYAKAISFLENRIDKILKNKAPELIWILEHPSIYTAGSSYNEREILDRSEEDVSKEPKYSLLIIPW